MRKYEAGDQRADDDDAVAHNAALTAAEAAELRRLMAKLGVGDEAEKTPRGVGGEQDFLVKYAQGQEKLRKRACQHC